MSFKNCKVMGKNIAPAVYHNRPFERGDIRNPMSPSELKNFAHCPSRYIRGFEGPESASKDFGNLLDTLVLTPEHFDARYILQPETYEAKGMKCPGCGSVSDSKSCSKCKCAREEVTLSKPWNNNSKTCSEWTEAQIKSGLEIVPQDKLTEGWTAAKRITEDEILASFIAASDKQVLVEGEWHDEATGLIIPVRCLLDLAPRQDTEFAQCLGDLKSSRSAAIIKFQRDVFNFGYHIQAAFDLDIFNGATKEQRLAWCFVVQENFSPFEIGRRMMRDVEPGEQPEESNLITLGRVQYRRMLANYAWCLANKKWPTYDDSDESSGGWTTVSAEPWMGSQVMFEPCFANQPPADEAAPEGDPDLIP